MQLKRFGSRVNANSVIAWIRRVSPRCAPRNGRDRRYCQAQATIPNAPFVLMRPVEGLGVSSAANRSTRRHGHVRRSSRATVAASAFEVPLAGCPRKFATRRLVKSSHRSPSERIQRHAGSASASGPSR